MQMFVKDLIDFWGDSLIKIDSQLINNSLLSENTKKLLLNVGMPLNNKVLITFYNGDVIKEYIIDDSKFICIGDDYGTQIGINENTSEVYSFDSMNEFPQRFVNSSIIQLLQFLMIYIKNQSEIINATDDEAAVIVDQIKKEFIKIDSLALDDDENWWSVILLQTEEGLM